MCDVHQNNRGQLLTLHSAKNPDTLPSSRLFSRIPFIAWILSIASISYLSLLPRFEVPLTFVWDDKVYHTLAYLWLSVLPFFSIERIKMASVAAFLMILLGIGLEFAQTLVPGRVFSVWDIIANSCGVVLGVLCGRYLLAKRTPTQALR